MFYKVGNYYDAFHFYVIMFLPLRGIFINRRNQLFYIAGFFVPPVFLRDCSRSHDKLKN